LSLSVSSHSVEELPDATKDKEIHGNTHGISLCPVESIQKFSERVPIPADTQQALLMG
jgi:hypothetical protein